MKNFNKILFVLIFSLCTFNLSAQVHLNGDYNQNSQITGSNAFIDGSTIFSTEAGANGNVGKGIVVPSVDLVNFEFDNYPDGFSLLPTYYDGMIVYNNIAGKTRTDGNNPSVAIDVVPGFYYFYNPKGSTNFSVTDGIWKPLGSNAGSGGSGSGGDCDCCNEIDCITPGDCDGDGFFGGDDDDDENPCSQEVTGLTATVTPLPDASSIITVSATDGTINNLSIDGGNTFVEGNSITVTPKETTIYTIRVNNCNTQIVVARVIPALPSPTITHIVGTPANGATFTVTRPTGWTNDEWAALDGDNFEVDVDGVPTTVTLTNNGDGTKSFTVAGSPSTAQTITVTTTGDVNGRPIAPMTPIVVTTVPCVSPAISAYSHANGETPPIISGNSTVITIGVTAAGNNLTYQWYKSTTAVNTGGTALTGAVYATFNTLGDLAKGQYFYYCEVTNGCGSVTSNVFTVTVGCGAYIAAGVWKEFMCHNLGANELYDPFVPHRELHGNFYKWGVKNPAVTAAENKDAGDAGVDGVGVIVINDWPSRGGGMSPTTGTGEWPSTADPCPSGFRIPTAAEWLGVADGGLNPQSWYGSGTWEGDHGSWTTGAKYGSGLFFPATFNYVFVEPMLLVNADRGISIQAHTRSRNSSGHAGVFHGSNFYGETSVAYWPMVAPAGYGHMSNHALPVRCIAE